MKVKSESEVAQSCLTPSNPMDCSPPGSSVHEICWARVLEWVAFPFSRPFSQPRDQTQVSHIAGNSLPAEPQGKSQNTGVGSLFLLQGIFPTHELNRGLLLCRRILYQLSYQGSLSFPMAAAAAKSLQSCPTLCDPMDCSPPGSAVPGILQARTLELPFPSPMHESEKRK